MDVERLTVGTVLYDTRDASVSCTVVNVSKDWVRVELPNGTQRDFTIAWVKAYLRPQNVLGGLFE